MALRQVRLPWGPNLDVGVGVDLASGAPRNSPVAPDATAVGGAGGASASVQITRIEDTAALESALGIDVEASYGAASFGAGASGRFTFAQNSKVQSSSLFMAIVVKVELEFMSIKTPKLTAAATELIDNQQIFEDRYGNTFVHGISRGGLFVGMISIQTSSSEEALSVGLELEGSYGLFSAEAKGKLSNLEKNFRNEVSIKMYHEGGPIDLKITNTQDPVQLLDNANAFLDSFAKTPAAVAVPYYVTLASISIAEGAVPINEAEIQQAQEVLMYCARRRSALWDQINLLDYIHDHPDRFVFSNGSSPEAVALAAVGFQEEIDVLAACASAAMNNRKSAQMPADYARERGLAFGVAALPLPMPTPAPKAIQSKVPPIPMPQMCGIPFGEIDGWRRFVTTMEHTEATALHVWNYFDTDEAKASAVRPMGDFAYARFAMYAYNEIDVVLSPTLDSLEEMPEYLDQSADVVVVGQSLPVGTVLSEVNTPVVLNLALVKR